MKEIKKVGRPAKVKEVEKAQEIKESIEIVKQDSELERAIADAERRLNSEIDANGYETETAKAILYDLTILKNRNGRN